VRAIQHGYFGGVAQSRDGSPAPSNYAMSYKSGHNASSSVASSVAEYPYPRSQNLSVTSLPRRPEPTKQFPSPLRLHPSDAQSIRSISMGPIDTTASVGGKGGAYIPPLALPRVFGRDSPAFGEEKPWVSPLDVHFSRPSTPKTQPASELESNLPRLNFPGHIEKSGLVMPTPAGSLFGAQSEKASIVSSSTAASGMPSKEALAPKQPMVATNLPQTSTRPSEGPSPFDFAFSSSQQEFRPPVSRSSTDKFALEQPLLLNNLPQQFSSIDPNLFPQKSSQRNTSTAVIRDSVVIKQRVSIHRPAHPEEHVPETPTTIHKRNSTAASSVYSSMKTCHLRPFALQSQNPSPSQSLNHHHAAPLEIEVDPPPQAENHSLEPTIPFVSLLRSLSLSSHSHPLQTTKTNATPASATQCTMIPHRHVELAAPPSKAEQLISIIPENRLSQTLIRFLLIQPTLQFPHPQLLLLE